MSASHTDITSEAHNPKSDGCKHSQLCTLNPLTKHKVDLVVRSSENQNVGSGVSLAQLMSEHQQKGKGTAGVDAGRGLSVPSLSALTIGTNSPPSIISNPNSLSLGTLASLNMSSASNSSTPSLLSVSLSSLSLNNPKLTTTGSSLAAPPGFGSLTSTFQSNPLLVGGGTAGKTTKADPKGSPSLADLIQEHSNHSPTISNSFPASLTGGISVKCQGPAAPAQTFSLSELASQHQNRSSHIQSQSQSTERLADALNVSEPTSITPRCQGGAVSLSQLALQHQTKSSSASPQPVNTESTANALKQPPGLSELLPLSHLTSEHKGETSTTSYGSQYSLASLRSPAKPEKAGVLAKSTSDSGVEHKLDHRPNHQNSRQHNPGQTIDLSTLMSQLHGAGPCHLDSDLSSLCRPASVALGGMDSSVFAAPSVFALTLSTQSRRQHRRTRYALKRKIRSQKTGSGYQPFLCKWQDKCTEQLSPMSPIVPFCFDTPSPDDIVRANQRKAFTR